MPEVVEYTGLRSRLVEELVKISADFRDKAAAVKSEYPVEPIWAQFMNDTAFRISLWSSQRVAYVAFYNGYEAFIVDCLKVGADRSAFVVDGCVVGKLLFAHCMAWDVIGKPPPPKHSAKKMHQTALCG